MIPPDRCMYTRDFRRCTRIEGHDGEHLLDMGEDATRAVRMPASNPDPVEIRITHWPRRFRNWWRAVWHPPK